MLLLMELGSNKFSQSFKFIMPNNNKFMQALGQSIKVHYITLHYVFASPTLALFCLSKVTFVVWIKNKVSY